MNQTAQQLERDVKKALRGSDFRWVEISIEGSKATLVGQVPDFWLKIRRSDKRLTLMVSRRS